jgi:hypothetical protein
MSIVAVHGPNTFGSRAVQETGPLLGTVDPTNGLKWDFKIDGTTTRSAQDFAWTFPPDGTPTPQNVADPTVVTYAAVGTTFGDPTRPTQPTKTAQCVVTNTAKATINNKALASNVATLSFSAAHGFTPGQRISVSGAIGAPFVGGPYTLITASGTTLTFALTAADVTSAATTGTATSDSAQYPAAGTYTVTVPVASGAAPQLLMMAPGGDGGEESGGEETPPEESSPDIQIGYDPGAHTVADVQQYVTEHPDQLEEMYEAEVAGKNRSSLVTWLEEQFPFDPGEWTVNEVIDYANEHPDELEEIIAAEQAGKNRSTLISQLEGMRPA